MNVSVLGTLRATADGKDVTPSAPKLRSLLALLALRHDRIVTTGTLMEELWGTNPPVSALATLQTYVYQLRRLLGSGGRETLVTKPLGYILHLDGGELDKDVFDQMVEKARAYLDDGSPQNALELLTRALQSCSASPLSDVEPGPVLSTHVNQLAESILQALELRIDASLQLGLHRELISDLKSLIAEHPFHEGFHAKLMVSLQNAGRRSEALEVYQTLRRNLSDELGIEPSAGLCKLQRDLLNADVSAAPAAQPRDSIRMNRFATPAQLPPDIADFVGREQVEDDLVDLLTDDRAGTALRLVTITGMAGVGKTTLAVRAAHRIRSQFPQGQFFADLCGTRGKPTDPFDVLGGFLRATGISGEHLPPTVEERTQLFRSATAERRLLVVLDDAVSAAQVLPLLPSGASCAVVVTGRAGLSSLAGARSIELDVPDIEECVELLSSVIGQGRIDLEPTTARTIVRLCGQLPLAIRTVGAKLTTSPKYPLHKFAERLGDSRRILQELRFGEFDVGARLAPSYLRLDADARDALRTLATCDGTGLTSTRAAGILGTDLAMAESLIEQLVEQNFLRPTESAAGGDTVFVLPSLAQSYVLSRMETEEACFDTQGLRIA